MSYQHHIIPEIFRDNHLFQAEQTAQLPLRLALLGLAAYADKAGRFLWRPNELKQLALPYDAVDFTKVLRLLVEKGYVLHYTYQNHHYGAIAVPPKTRRRTIDHLAPAVQ